MQYKSNIRLRVNIREKEIINKKRMRYREGRGEGRGREQSSREKYATLNECVKRNGDEVFGERGNLREGEGYEASY